MFEVGQYVTLKKEFGSALKFGKIYKIKNVIVNEYSSRIELCEHPNCEYSSNRFNLSYEMPVTGGSQLILF